LASKRNGVLGVTSNLSQRMAEHTQGLVPGFTLRYGVKQLIYYEFHDTMDAAIRREKQLKEWRRAWKVRLIESMNPDMFGVSVPQASKDLAQYQELAPSNIAYDKSAKRYVAGASFAPRFFKPDADTYLSRLRSLSEGLIKSTESWIASPPASDIALTPERDIDMDALRAILSAVRDVRSIEIFYQSMSEDRPDPIWRRISPHAFGYDGFRWHVRAYCHIEQTFKDFLLPRTLDYRSPDRPGKPGSEDRLWQEYFTFEIVPHPRLTQSQQSVVAKDYGMKGSKCSLTVRYAVLFYVLKRLGLLADALLEDPASDPASVRAALKKAEFVQDTTQRSKVVR
jgi:predicted GIY-YIG superfamily endonuclease